MLEVLVGVVDLNTHCLRMTVLVELWELLLLSGLWILDTPVCVCVCTVNKIT